MKSLLCTLGAALLALAAGIGPSHASVVIAGTRVVFSAATGETTVHLTNEGKLPALVEAWIDDGNPASTPDTAKVPFLITPPLTRMDAGRGQSLRIIYTGQPLPTDRESLFWLNVLEIPPKPVTKPGEERNTLQFAVRSRLKLFFRPASLAGNPLTAGEQLGWSVAADGTGYALVVRNPTPYYITISKLTLHVDGAAYITDSGMVAPLASLHLPVKDLHRAPSAGSAVDYTVINDFGAGTSYKGTVTP
ncbi:fimbria/pilus periplasmic chaperone [Rhodanobacter sp. KK11]|uniref:fimbrial biogenesis chaperone n=1 Tax=Rhodanobacter sp. KK11 TaxID=3083255 RepID=UPI0029663C79|nr:fimbria/pilus periplasmic chaperone [Rhodanobacter sp. KK11]MDW2982968.1 fimbria/pilus periplasmic chaperone [Rhodanobacter sp. KK11]